MNSKIFKVGVLASFILLNIAGLNFAQDSSIQFETFPIPGVDYSTVVLQVEQDSTGFLWFATHEGVYRYNGRTFTHFTHDPEDSTSLSANRVETIYVDQGGTIWIGTFSNGLNQFHPETETFTHYHHDPQIPTSISSDSVTVITEDTYGDLWVGTRGGLNRLDRETYTFARYQYDPDDSTSLGNDDVWSLFVDSEGTLWVGMIDKTRTEPRKPGPGGLNRFNRDSGTFTRFLHDPENPNSLMSNRVSSIFEDSRGTFWVGTYGNIVHKMDRETGQFERMVYNPDLPGIFQFPNEPSLSPTCKAFYCGAIASIVEDASGSLWIGLLTNGVLRLHPDTNTLDYFDSNEANSIGFLGSNVWNLFQSRDGTLWISPILSHVTKISLQTYTSGSKFQSQGLPLNTILGGHYVEESGKIWLGEYHQLRSLTPAIENEGPYQIDASIPFVGRTVGAIHKSRDGTFWVGSYEGNAGSLYGGLYALNEQTLTLDPVFVDSDRPSIYIGPIIDIYEDLDGILWLGTKYAGLIRYDRRSNTLTQYLHDPNNRNSLISSERIIVHGSKSKPGILWIGTDRGLNRFDTGTESFTRYPFDSNESSELGEDIIKNIFEDSQNNLWIGTHSTGLIHFKPTSEEFTRYTTYNSAISGNNVDCILESSDGSIWMGTDRGLTHLNPETELFFTYDENHGIDAAPFVDKCSIVNQQRFLFTGNSQLLVFDPTNIQPATSPSAVAFTDFFVDNQPVRFSSEGVLQTPFWMSKEIELPYSQNTFALEFSVLDFRSPEANRYAYYLEGFDESWSESGNTGRAAYERIPAGKYTFRVRGANSDGVWNVDGASIGITILPPWWQTWWAYGLYALIFAAGVFAVDRFQRRRLIKREREKARERELEQAREIEKAYHNLEIAHENLKSAQEQLVQQEKLASLGQLTAGIAHEIKNPLNFVNNFSDLSTELIQEAREEIKSVGAIHELPLQDVYDILDDIENNLHIIHQHGTRADGIIKSMLQHSRGGDGKMEPTPLNPLIKEYVNLAFRGMRAGKDPINVDIELGLDKNVGEVEMIGEDFSRVILNLCNNAFDAMRDKLTVDSGQLTKSPLEGSGGAERSRGVSSMEGYEP
ncbi:ligand-binding sensor domain-containing protein, partial [Rhodohalobacter sulfatireducens]